MKWNDSNEPETLASNEVKAKWPHLLVKFFEKKMKFSMQTNPVEVIEVFESIGPIDCGPPVRILGCTDKGGLQYWCEWDSKRRKLISSQHAQLAENVQLMNFFEDKLTVDDEVLLPIITRNMKRKAAQFGFSYAMKPIIFRNIQLEEYILQKPSHIVERRHTHCGDPVHVEQTENEILEVDLPVENIVAPEAQSPNVPEAPNVPRVSNAPVTLKLKVAIPIGVRGRKRRLNSVPAPYSSKS